MRRLIRWLAGGVVAATLCYVAWGSWQVIALLDTILRAGSPIAQGEGAPPPGRPEDIGFVGDPGAAFGFAYETIAVETELGPAPAWLVPTAEATAPLWAIVVHGIGGRRENGYRFLPELRRNGLPVLLVSYRNDEEAPPAPDGLYSLGLTEWRDLEAAVRLCLDRGASEVVLVAESMGGAIVGQFLRRSELAARVRAIVLDAPMVDLPLTLSSLVGRIGIPLPRTVSAGALVLARWRYPIPLSEAVVTEDLAGFDGPLFLSHGAGDRIVPVAGSDSLAAARPQTTRYLRSGADHILSWKEDPQRYDEALGIFLEHLR